MNKVELKKWNLWLFIGGVVLYFFVNFHRSAIPGTIFNELQSDFNATASQVAAMSAVFMYVYSFTQLIAGVVVDKYGGVRAILVFGVLFCLGALIFPFCSTLSALYAGRILVGFGAGVIYLAMVKEVDRLYPRNFTMVLGLVILLGYSGSIFGGLPLSMAVSVVHWRWIFGIIGVLILLAYGGYFFCRTRIRLPRIIPEPLSVKPLLITLQTRNSIYALIAGGCCYSVYYMMLTVAGKKFLEDFCSTSPQAAGACLSVMVIVSAGTNFLSGFLSTKMGNRRRPFLITAMSAGVLGTILALIGLQVNAGGWLFIIVLQIFAFSAGFSPITNSLIREFNPPQYTGAGASMLNFVAYFSVAVCANLAGYLMDNFAFGNTVKTATSIIYPTSSYMAVFVLALIMALLSLIAAIMVPETYGRNCYPK